MLQLQVKVVINYNIEDESLVGQRINAVMVWMNRVDLDLKKDKYH